MNSQSSTQDESRISLLRDGDKEKGTALCDRQAGSQEKVLLQRIVQSWNRLPGAVVTATSCWSSGRLGQCSQKYGLIFGWCCVEPGIGLNDPCWPLPTQNIV